MAPGDSPGTRSPSGLECRTSSSPSVPHSQSVSGHFATLEGPVSVHLSMDFLLDRPLRNRLERVLPVEAEFASRGRSVRSGNYPITARAAWSHAKFPPLQCL